MWPEVYDLQLYNATIWRIFDIDINFHSFDAHLLHCNHKATDMFQINFTYWLKSVLT